MLETFRKYTGLMFVVLILIFVGLVFFGSSNTSLTGPKEVTAHDQGFTRQQFDRFAVRPTRLIQRLLLNGRANGMEGYLIFVGGSRNNGHDIDEYLINRLSLQRAMAGFGIHASTAEVETFLKDTLFWEDGAFNQQAYSKFLEEELKSLGMTVKDLNELMGEVICFQKLEELLGAGVETSRELVLSDYLSRQQRISYQVLAYPITDYLAKPMPTEAEIKDKWDSAKDSYQSDPKRRVSYIIAAPDYAALVKAKTPPEAGSSPEPAAPGEPAAGTGEGACQEPGDKPEDKPEDKLTDQEKKEAVFDLAMQFDELLEKIDAGAPLAKAASDLGFEVKSTGLVEQDKLPGDFSSTFRNAPGTVAEAVFSGSAGTTKVHGIGKDQWIYFQIEEVVEESKLSYEDARELVKKDLVRESAIKVMEEEANSHRTAITEAMATGKSFTEAAEELKLNPVVRKEITGDGRMGAVRREYEKASRVNPGVLSETITDNDEALGLTRSFFIFVEKREVYEDPNLATMIDILLERRASDNRRIAAANWFAQQRALSGFERLATH